MAAASCVLTEDQFLCPICLDVLTDPVTIPCGHNFCKNCITQQWENIVPCMCPMCRKLFSTRPVLQVNNLISEMATEFSKSRKQETCSSSTEEHSNKPEVVCCDLCTENKQKAVKSCLTCLASYCEIHLKPHKTVTGLKIHQLIDSVNNLESRMCTKHNKLLELFCKVDQTCVCLLCTVLEHKTHSVVPLKDAYEEKKTELRKTDAEIQQIIQKTKMKIQEIKRSMELSNEDADREKAKGVQVYTNLMQYLEEGLKNFIDNIEEDQRTTEKQSECFIKELKQDISELMKGSSKIEQLLHTDDHLNLLQNFSSLKAPLPTKNWKNDPVQPSPYESTIWKAVYELEKSLSKTVNTAILWLMQQHTVDVTLDPDTANCNLILSEDGKQVMIGNASKQVRESPKRFSWWFNVLGKESFSSGRSYYEVQVNGKNEWYLGVARQSMTRKGNCNLSPQQGYWTLWLRGKSYSAGADPSVSLSLESNPQKVGVFVDYEEGLVIFVDVDCASLIHCFTNCSFTEQLYPFFNPGNNNNNTNSAPLIITSVSYH